LNDEAKGEQCEKDGAATNPSTTRRLRARICTAATLSLGVGDTSAWKTNSATDAAAANGDTGAANATRE
jgi:hypothetical protein